MKKPCDFNLVEERYIDLCKLYDTINENWKIEINYDGLNYSFLHQNTYKFAFEGLLRYKLKETINQRISDNFLDDLKNLLIPKLIENIDLYDKHKLLFEKYNRKKIQVDLYKAKMKSNLSEEKIADEINDTLDDFLPSEYYSSSFYAEIGYITVNFHFDIYFFSKQLLRDINNNFKDYLPYDCNNLKTNKEQFFSLKILSNLWEYVNDEIIDTILEYDFCSELNFFRVHSRIKIKDKHIVTFCFIINNLKKKITDRDRAKIWEEAIIKNFNINPSTYNSKKTSIKDDKIGKEILLILNPIKKV